MKTQKPLNGSLKIFSITNIHSPALKHLQKRLQNLKIPFTENKNPTWIEILNTTSRQIREGIIYQGEDFSLICSPGDETIFTFLEFTRSTFKQSSEIKNIPSKNQPDHTQTQEQGIKNIDNYPHLEGTLHTKTDLLALLAAKLDWKNTKRKSSI